MLKIVQKALGIKSELNSEKTNELLFTFDDGPDPVVTGRVLDELDKAGAKAVFFVVGNRIKKAEHMLREVLDRGHLIGNHSHSHWPGKPPSSVKEYLADVVQCQQRIFQTCGYTPDLYRPPLGAVNAATILSARKLQMQVYKWSLDSNDWRLRDDETAKTQGIETANKARPGDIVLMHDDNIHSPVMLREMLPGLLDAGFTLHSFVDQQISQGEAVQRTA